MSCNRMFLRFCSLVLLFIFFNLCETEKITYLSLERPILLYCNKKYLDYCSISSRRYSREDPKYYFNCEATFTIPLDNRISVVFNFENFVSNTYKKTFFEMRFKLCDLINNDKFIGSSLRQGSLKSECPYRAGHHYIANATIPVASIPKNFPFKKARLVTNLTYFTGELISNFYIEFEIKEKIVLRKSKKQ